jgi:chitinase
MLDGTQSFDLDGDPITFSWIQLPGGQAAVSFANTNTATPIVQVPIIGGGGAVMTFQLTVSDGQDSSSDTVSVIINTMPSHPVACVGVGTGIFDSPMNKPVSVNKKARVLPFNMTLIDEY